jgi:hypothetical protein
MAGALSLSFAMISSRVIARARMRRNVERWVSDPSAPIPHSREAGNQFS